MKITAKVIQFPDFDGLRFRKETIEQAAKAGGQVIEAYAKINVERTFSGKSSGGAGLAGSIQTRVLRADAEKAMVEVGPSVVYGRIQELGGWIEPVQAKVLQFFVDGVEIFTKKVYLPARPYLRPAADEHMDDIRNAIAAVLRAALKRFA